MTEPTASALFEETLDALRANDLITPVERLRRSTYDLLDWLPEGVSGEQAEAGFPELRTRLERYFAIAQPLLDFGAQRGVEEVCWTLQTLASEQGDSAALLREPMLSLALHDLAWTLLADCLSRDRLDSLPRLAAVAIPSNYEKLTTSVFQAPDLRYSNALGREANSTYLSWHDWLTSSEFVGQMSHLGTGPRLTAPLAEAELIAALCFAAEHSKHSFCASLGERIGERRLRAHLHSPSALLSLAALFETQPDELPVRINELYACLVGRDGFGSSGPLLATG